MSITAASTTTSATTSATLVRSWKDADLRGDGAHPAGEVRLPALGAEVSRARALAGFTAGAAMSMPMYPTLTMSVTAWSR